MTRDVIRLKTTSLADGCLPSRLIRMDSSRSFQDAQEYDLQTDSPTATRYGFRVASQHAASMYWGLLHLDLKTAFLQGETYDLDRRLSMFSCLLTLVCLLTWLVYALVPSMDLRTHLEDGGTA